MTEAEFKTKIYRRVSPYCYVQAMADRLRPGVPDHWYSGPKADLWVEYKVCARPRAKTVTPHLSKPQRLWLAGRHREGRQVWAVVGLTQANCACLVFKNGEWDEPKAVTEAVLFSEYTDELLEAVGVISWN